MILCVSDSLCFGVLIKERIHFIWGLCVRSVSLFAGNNEVIHHLFATLENRLHRKKPKLTSSQNILIRILADQFGISETSFFISDILARIGYVRQ